MGRVFLIGVRSVALVQVVSNRDSHCTPSSTVNSEVLEGQYRTLFYVVFLQSPTVTTVITVTTVTTVITVITHCHQCPHLSLVITVPVHHCHHCHRSPLSSLSQLGGRNVTRTLLHVTHFNTCRATKFWDFNAFFQRLLWSKFKGTTRFQSPKIQIFRCAANLSGFHYCVTP
jgi:hypothetical protein